MVRSGPRRIQANVQLAPIPNLRSLAPGTAGFVQSPGGLSPPGSPRSVGEPLDSYGSRCSAVSMAEPPVGKERWIGSAQPVKPVSRPLGFATQPLELAARPADDIEIDPLQGQHFHRLGAGARTRASRR